MSVDQTSHDQVSLTKCPITRYSPFLLYNSVGARVSEKIFVVDREKRVCVESDLPKLDSGTFQHPATPVALPLQASPSFAICLLCEKQIHFNVWPFKQFSFRLWKMEKRKKTICISDFSFENVFFCFFLVLSPGRFIVARGILNGVINKTRLAEAGLDIFHAHSLTHTQTHTFTHAHTHTHAPHSLMSSDSHKLKFHLTGWPKREKKNYQQPTNVCFDSTTIYIFIEAFDIPGACLIESVSNILLMTFKGLKSCR